jgi:hypothetical protein
MENYPVGQSEFGNKEYPRHCCYMKAVKWCGGEFDPVLATLISVLKCLL